MASESSKNQKNYLTPNEVAELLMVSPTTVRHWSSQGRMQYLLTPGGHRRFLKADVERFCKENNLTLALPEADVTRILIVDDDEEITEMLAKFFKHSGSRATTKIASSGFDAGRLVTSFMPHVVLLDLMMPGIDGFEVCRMIKDDPATKATRVIAMTGFYDDGNVERILSMGAETCLSKPFQLKSMTDAIGIE